jgi:hypothetical protein
MVKKRVDEEFVPPSLSPDRAIQLFKQQISKIDELKKLTSKDPEVGAFKNFNINLINKAFGKPSENLSSYYSAEHPGAIYAGMSDDEWERIYLDGLNSIHKLFQGFISQLEAFTEEDNCGAKQGSYSSVEKIQTICDRFPLIVRSLRKRYKNRPTISVSDEYDVQDIFRVLLALYFDDIRPEEWVPSYAGGNSRMDFLLKRESIVIEIKKTRETLKDKDIGDQLIIDIARYQTHPECKALFCFVYDPEGFISNPIGLERDLARKDNNLEVIVIIAPKG